MKSNPSREKETRMDAYYREQWEYTSGKEIPAEAGERIFRALRRRIRSDVFRPVPGRWLRYAAAILVGAIIGFGIRLLPGRTPAAPESAPADLVVFADKGQRSNVVLPDGTKVWLNSHSKITYPRDYGVRERSLSLTGEACFEVAKDPEKRFTVHAGDMRIEALGTSFNVKAYDDDREITTTLFNGSVRATVRDKTVTLEPEQYATFDRENRRISTGHAENAAYAAMWRDNELAFNRQTLDEIAVIFNRLYNVEIRFESEKIRNYRFSGVIKNNSLDNVIEIISLTAPISYRYRGDTILLSERKEAVRKNKISSNH
jgi:ferric-dicitrate binding protein FerR (iron transport regulator)